MLEESLRAANEIAAKLFETAQAVWSLKRAVRKGELAPSDARVRDFDRLRVELRKLGEEAQTKLVPFLVEFAAVQEWPIKVHGFTSSSAHQAALRIGEWALQLGWSGDKVQRFLDRFYRADKKEIDWDTARNEDPEFAWQSGEIESRGWAEHKSLLEMEYAKALKLATQAAPKVPKLRNIERCILEALGDEPLTMDELADRAGYPNNSNFRGRVSAMIDRELVAKVPVARYGRGALSGHCQV